jgi:hypothetical protein
MLSLTELRRFRPAFVTPCYGDIATTNFIRSLLALQNALRQNSIGASIHIRAGDSLVTRARNEATAEFLAEPSYTHLFWIDSDVGFSADQVFRLLAADRDVVAGAYPIKKHFWPEHIPAGLSREALMASSLRFPVNAANGSQAMPAQVDADGFLEVSEAPTGFMVIKREVFIRMMQRMPDLQYMPDGPPSLAHRDLHYRFFDVLVDPQTKRYLSEDYAFCHRWRALGGRVYVDMNAKLSHQGVCLYEGDFAATFALAPDQAVGGPAG